MSEKSAIEIPIYNNVVEFLALQDPNYTININDIVYFHETNNRWERALATENARTQGLGYVRSSNASNFLIVLFGLINIENTNPLYNTYQPGKVYYLSNTLSGKLVSNEYNLQFHSLQRVCVCVGQNLILITPQDYRENNDLKIRTSQVESSVAEDHVVYYNSINNRWERAFASNNVNTIATGYILEKKIPENVYTIILGGVVTKTHSLTPGTTYYLSQTPGGYTNNINLISNNYYYQEVLKAIDSNNFLFQPKPMVETLNSGTLNITTSTTDLSISRFNLYIINMITNQISNINFTNGLPGKYYPLQIISSGTNYTWGSNIFWPNNILPTASISGKTDVFSFLCVEPNKFLGTFAFNYN